jgi:glycosyltransferase involved in cell wall biosynthesis
MTAPLPAAPAPAISVIVPAWGVAHLVGEALASLQAQSFTDWEAIVVDDGGPDDVAGAVAPFTAADPRIRFVPMAHRGVSGARNHAIAAARAPLIALLDGDDLYLPAHLETLHAAMTADPGLGIVSCDAYYTGQPAREGLLFSHFWPQADEPTLEAVLTRRSSIFIAALVRREAIEAVGGFDEALVAAEDLDLWIRILSAGWRARQLGIPLARYRRRPESASAATLRITRTTLEAYEKAARALAGRPEGRIASEIAAKTAAEIGWLEAEEMVIDGQVREGLRRLRVARAGRRSSRWRLMMALFRVAPPLARPVLAWRRRQWAKA